MRRAAIVLTVLAAAWAAAPAADAAVIKLATLVPEGSVWDKALRRMGEEWRRDTEGRVELRIYPGGVAGDEPDVVRKMRIGQLQAGTVTIAGLAEIDDSFEALGIPLMFDSYDELYAVLDALEEELAAKLEAKGFVLLHWGHGGWVHVFSREPVTSVADLEDQKLFVWAGDDDRVQMWKRNGFQPVPLAGTDILTGLQTGLIDVLPAPPLAALSLQWFRQAPNMLDLGVAPLVGGTIVSKRAWDRLEAADREALRGAARRVEETLEAEVPEQDREAIAQMTQRGLNVTEPGDMAEWQRAAERFVASTRGSIVPEEMLARVLAARDAYRRTAGDPGS